jgi:hypothetical protein
MSSYRPISLLTTFSKVFETDLTDRKQKIEIKSSNLTQRAYSNWETIKHEVPRGKF